MDSALAPSKVPEFALPSEPTPAVALRPRSYRHDQLRHHVQIENRALWIHRFKASMRRLDAQLVPAKVTMADIRCSARSTIGSANCQKRPRSPTQLTIAANRR